MSNHRNVEAFTRLIGFCTGFGGNYNPGRPNLQLDALTTLLAEARKKTDQWTAAGTRLTEVISHREAAFKDVRALCTQIVNALKASGAEAQIVADAQMMIRRISGVRVPDREPVATESGATAAARRRSGNSSYEAVARTFSGMVQLVTAQPQYAPLEAHLSREGLARKKAALLRLNQEVGKQRVAYNLARLAMREALYQQPEALLPTARKVKAYVKSVFGARSDEYRQVSKLKFNQYD